MNISIKKILGLATCLYLFTAVNCENEPLDEDFFDFQNTSCEFATEVTAAAALDFADANIDNYAQLCNTYRTALQTQIEVCGDPNGVFSASIDALDSCNNGQSVSDIIGTWQLTAWLVQNGLDLNNDGSANLNLLDEMDCYNNETIVFNTDNRAFINSRSFAEIVVEFEAGSTNSFDYFINCIEEENITTATWTEDGDSITLAYDGTDEEIQFTLETNQLSLLVPEGFFAQSSDFSLEVLEDITIVYTKL